MGRSFVLRQPGGALAGYMMANRDALQLRASGIPAAGAELTLIDAKGVQSRRRLRPTDQEQTLDGTGGEIAAAYAIGGGRVILATDAQTLRTAERELAGRMRTPAEEAGKQRAHHGRGDAPGRTAFSDQHSGEQAAQESGACAEERIDGAPREERARPDGEPAQRRWPPPPCLMGARYEGGRWVTAIRTTSDMPGAPPRCGAT